MLSIGSNVKIASGVIVLCHDYSRAVLIDAFGENVGEAAITSIGDSVFIGMNAIVLMGSRIGNDCVIGAGSVVSGSIPSRPYDVSIQQMSESQSPPSRIFAKYGVIYSSRYLSLYKSTFKHRRSI